MTLNINFNFDTAISGLKPALEVQLEVDSAAPAPRYAARGTRSARAAKT